MTILLGKDNKVAWYMGEAGKSQPVVEGFNQIRQSILNNKAKVHALHPDEPKKSLFVIIKPTAGANYKNFVDIMDELKVTQITAAPAIDDEHISPEELDFMKQQKLLWHKN